MTPRYDVTAFESWLERLHLYRFLKRISWSYWGPALALCVGGLALRIYDVRYSLDGDEVFSTLLASNGLREVIDLSLQDKTHPPLHNLCLHFWIQIFGSSEASVRGLSITASAGFLVVFAALVRRFVGTPIALALLAVTAFSSFFVYYGQQARPFSLAAFVGTLNLFWFFRLLHRPDEPKTLGLWSATAALWLYTQYFAALLLLPQFILLAFTKNRWRTRNILVGLTSCMTIFPWLFVAFFRAEQGGLLPHIAWITRPTILDVLQYFTSLIGQPAGVRTRWLLAAIALCLLPLAVSALRRRLSASESVILGMAALPPFLAYYVSIIAPISVWATRQLIVSGVAFLLAIALSLKRLPPVLSTLLGTLLVAWAVLGIPDAFPRASTPPWREIVADIRSAGHSRVVVEDDWVRRPLEYYGLSVELAGPTAHEYGQETSPLVCRPERCSEIHPRSRWDLNSPTVYPWGQFAGTTTHEIKIYWPK